MLMLLLLLLLLLLPSVLLHYDDEDGSCVVAVAGEKSMFSLTKVTGLPRLLVWPLVSACAALVHVCS